MEVHLGFREDGMLRLAGRLAPIAMVMELAWQPWQQDQSLALQRTHKLSH